MIIILDKLFIVLHDNMSNKARCNCYIKMNLLRICF
ncbi:hypothetical protein U728_1006 [Clostridium botulinum 202F]|nr:hypothetical protein U728_1006 [Clostridium botulinum 202F]